MSRDGYFSPESVIRKVGNTPLTPFLGGGPAVLLQVAHPLVAVGVVQHSDYRRDLWRRLGRTVRALYLITYGTKAEAERAAEAVQTVHARVHGKTDVQLGRFPAGTSYSASDPALMLWVHATLVEASLCVYQRFVQTLSPEEQERYYQEMALVARLFGTPASAIPRSLADFRDYVAAQVASETISVTAPAREVAAVILDAPLPAPMRLLVPALRLATAGLLPPRLRHEYGLRWSPLHELALPLAARSLRLTTTAALIASSRLARLPRELAAEGRDSALLTPAAGLAISEGHGSRLHLGDGPHLSHLEWPSGLQPCSGPCIHAKWRRTSQNAQSDTRASTTSCPCRLSGKGRHT